MYVFFVFLAKICWGIVTDGTYKRVRVVGGGIKKASGHIMDLVVNKWYLGIIQPSELWRILAYVMAGMLTVTLVELLHECTVIVVKLFYYP
jgi:hypothetical protein